MTKQDLYNQEGQIIGSVELPESVFSVSYNADLVYQVVRAKSANQRTVVAHSKGRSEVRGGGKKPWRQKGTGRARHGSIRSPIWIGGGVAHGPNKGRNYSIGFTKNMDRQAVKVVLSQKAKENELRILDSLNLAEAKTKPAAKILENFFPRRSKIKNPSVLILNPEKNRKLVMAFRNIPKAKIISADSVGIMDLVNYKYIMMPQNTISILSAKLKK